MEQRISGYEVNDTEPEIIYASFSSAAFDFLDPDVQEIAGDNRAIFTGQQSQLPLSLVLNELADPSKHPASDIDAALHRNHPSASTPSTVGPLAPIANPSANMVAALNSSHKVRRRGQTESSTELASKRPRLVSSVPSPDSLCGTEESIGNVEYQFSTPSSDRGCS